MPKIKLERDYLFYLLSKQEYSYAKLKQKLVQRKNLLEDEIETLLAEFVKNQWQSDERYTELMLDSCINKHYGFLRIQQKIVYEKGIDAALLEKTISKLEIDWFNEAQLCYQQKYHDKYTDLKEKQKRVQYLLRQGHGLSIALPVVDRNKLSD